MTGAAGPPDALAETSDLQGAYPRLDDEQIAALAAVGSRRAVRPGQILFREGDRDYDFHVVLDGKVAVVAARGTPEERLIGVHGHGRFLGELGLLAGEASFYTAIVVADGEALMVGASQLRELMARDPVFGDIILHAFLVRRSILIGLGAGLCIVGSRYSPDTRRIRDFAARNRIPHRWLDLEADPPADQLLARTGVRPEETPLVLVYGRVLRNPTNTELAAAIGLPAPVATHSDADVLVVGAGPAGLSAAVYGASEGLRVVVLDGVATGGQAGTSSRIENYLGFPAGISGAELAERATLQARKFGAQFAIPGEARSIRRDGPRYTVDLADGTAVTANAVVAASGARYRRLNVPRADHFAEMSIYYAASQAEALICHGDPVAVVGGGNSAGQAAVFLSRHAAQVTMIVREHDLSEFMSRYLIDQVTRTGNVSVMLGSEIRELLGDQSLQALDVEDRDTGARRTVKARALFVFIGTSPSTGWLGNMVETDDAGFIRTGDRSPLETSEPGIFAAGDVRSGSTKRVATAVGEGAMVIRLALERTQT
ncbi:MAG TPA: FAD-dependent oxidoreductase [Streptosporangiaceae bacterium]|nr:FAD-dependent oxidoreductase [Streptosporangiaceae bacterium]